MMKNALKQTAKVFSGAVLLAGLSVSAFAGKPVNINKADAETLAKSLDGVGFSKAEEIVKFREAKKAPFKTLAELEEVKGLGPKTLEKNKEFIQF